MEADSDFLKKTKQNMREGRNEYTTSLEFHLNRIQQIPNSKIQNSEESIVTKEFENSFFEMFQNRFGRRGGQGKSPEM